MQAALFLALVIGTAALTIDQEPVPAAASETETPGKAVFYAVIMGAKYSRRHQVSLWLSSLRLQKLGNWGGEAVLVTDKPGCIEKTLQETKMIGEKTFSSEFVDIFAPPKGMKGNLHIVKRPHTGNVLKIKLEKARAWHNVRNANIPGKVDMIVYNDEDIVVGKDVNRFVQEVSTLVPNKHTMALFRDTGKSKGELHTGVVVIYNNEDSEQCLRQWGISLTGLDINNWNKSPDGVANNRKSPYNLVTNDTESKLADIEEFEKEEGSADETDSEDMLSMTDEMQVLEGPDQQALGKTKECTGKKSSTGIKILPKEYFWFPNSDGLKKGNTAEFIHFTNTGRMVTLTRGVVTDYLQKIGIPDYIDALGHSGSDECLVWTGGAQ